MNVERLRLAQLHHQLTVVETVASDAQAAIGDPRADRLAEYLVGTPLPRRRASSAASRS